MKRYIYLTVALSSMLFAACSSDNEGSTDNGGIATDGGLLLGASLNAVQSDSRIATTSTNTLTTNWSADGSDKLTVYNKYLNNGVAGDMTGIDFVNKTKSGTQTDQFYNGPTTTTFNTTSGDNAIFAFNKLATEANYTQTYNTDGTFTLTQKGLGEDLNITTQSGLATDLYKYDAMYGVTTANSADYSKDVTMHHINTVLKFDMKNGAFGTNSISDIHIESVDAANSLIPAGTATYTLSADGSTLTNKARSYLTYFKIGSAATAVSGIAPFYLMTYPGTYPYPTASATGHMVIYASNGDVIPAENTPGATGSVFYGRYLSYTNLNLLPGRVKEVTVTMNKNNYCKWDAADNFPTVENTTAYSADLKASNLCANCPTLDEFRMYVGAGFYYDNPSSSTAKSWTDCYGQPHKGGYWFKKKSKIDGFSTGTATKKTTGTGTVGTPTNTDDYFYVPACDDMKQYNWIWSSSGNAWYWSSTPAADASGVTQAYELYLQSGNAYVRTEPRYHGGLPWPGEGGWNIQSYPEGTAIQ